jgi:hypothetical protein
MPINFTTPKLISTLHQQGLVFPNLRDFDTVGRCR